MEEEDRADYRLVYIVYEVIKSNDFPTKKEEEADKFENLVKNKYLHSYNGWLMLYTYMEPEIKFWKSIFIKYNAKSHKIFLLQLLRYIIDKHNCCQDLPLQEIILDIDFEKFNNI